MGNDNSVEYDYYEDQQGWEKDDLYGMQLWGENRDFKKEAKNIDSTGRNNLTIYL